MKISGGILGSRKIKTLEGGGTRPTSSKIRSAIFNSLGQKFSGGYVLDLFSGSGAMAFEAISRGYEFAVCIDSSRLAAKIIKENSVLLGIAEKIEIQNMDFKLGLKRLEAMQEYNLIIVDPPYDLLVLEEVMEKIATMGILANDGNVVLEFSKKSYQGGGIEPPNFEKIFHRIYDDTVIEIFRKESSEIV
ncbi:methylase [Erysipelotrichaceae bacterium]|nr:methylase [Erysipelotrichaceae bacterium]